MLYRCNTIHHRYLRNFPGQQDHRASVRVLADSATSKTYRLIMPNDLLHARRISDIKTKVVRLNYIRSEMAEFSPDFCVELSEAVLVGEYLPKCPSTSSELLKIALEKSIKIGAYGLGRHHAVLGNIDESIEFFSRTASLGHLPSKILIFSYIKEMRWHNPFVVAIERGKLRFCAAVASFRLALNESDTRNDFWRIRDVVPDFGKRFSPLLDEDRTFYFDWSMPSSIEEFAAKARS